MRLDDPRPRPGETEEQRQQRLVKAAKYTKLARESRAMAGRSALAGRILRLVVLVICGIGLTGAGIHNFADPAQTGSPEGFGNQHFGPHGNAISLTALGLLVLGLSAYFLLRYIRLARKLPPAASPNP